MTYEITILEPDGKEYTYMLGDSYKNWTQQFRELCSEAKPLKLVAVWTSKEHFPQDGTKWILKQGFQDLLNDLGIKKSFEYWRFDKSKKDFKTANEILQKFLPKSK